MADAEGSVYWYNERWTEYTGLTMNDMQGWGWRKAHHPDHVNRISEFLRWHGQNVSRLKSLIYCAERMELTVGFLSQVHTRLAMKNGKIMQWIGALTDIDEQKRGEDHFRALADDAPLWIWYADEKAEMQYANHEMLHFFGIKSSAEFTSEFWRQMIHPGDISRMRDTVASAYQKQKAYALECRLKNLQNGEYEWFALRAVPRFLDGKFEGFTGTAHNIQGQKISVAHLEEAVAIRTKALHQANIDLKTSNDELTRFAHAASHDLKEPLRKIRLFMDQVENKVTATADEETKNSNRENARASRRMSELIDGILRYSSLTQVKEPLINTDLNVVIQQIQQDLELVLDQKNGRIVIAGPLPMIAGLPTLLYQLMYNLIGNSLKFSRVGAPPMILVSAAAMPSSILQQKNLNVNRNYTCITIEDNGIGFEQKESTKIFDAYYRLHHHSQYDGTRLGLALCKRIVERHGGIIEAEGKYRLRRNNSHYHSN